MYPDCLSAGLKIGGGHFRRKVRWYAHTSLGNDCSSRSEDGIMVTGLIPFEYKRAWQER